MRDAQLRLAANRSVGNQPDWSLLLTEFSHVIGDRVVLQRLSLNPSEEVGPDGKTQQVNILSLTPERASGRTGGFVIEMAGFGMDQAAVWDFVLRLEKTGLFDRVSMVGSQGQQHLGGRAIAFTLVCRMDPQKVPHE